MSLPHEIRRRLRLDERFTLAELRGWMEDESSLELWTAVCEVLRSTPDRVRPPPDMDDACAFLTRYRLRAIRENVQSADAEIPTGYEAAADLARCFKLWASRLPETRSVLIEAAEKFTAAYRAAGDEERDRLLNGCLEHALELAAVRPFFDRWKNDPELAEPWRRAMEWAVAHGDRAAH